MTTNLQCQRIRSSRGSSKGLRGRASRLPEGGRATKMAAPEVDTCSERAGRPAPLPLNYCQSYNNNRITMEFFPIFRGYLEMSWNMVFRLLCL